MSRQGSLDFQRRLTVEMKGLPGSGVPPARAQRQAGANLQLHNGPWAAMIAQTCVCIDLRVLQSLSCHFKWK